MGKIKKSRKELGPNLNDVIGCTKYQNDLDIVIRDIIERDHITLDKLKYIIANKFEGLNLTKAQLHNIQYNLLAALKNGNVTYTVFLKFTSIFLDYNIKTIVLTTPDGEEMVVNVRSENEV